MAKSGNKKRFSCGHTGFGGYCHRCQWATELEEMAAAGHRYVDHKRQAKSRRWTIEDMLEEAKRLRTEGRRH